MTIRAVFEQGVFRPKQAVHLPDHAEVELEIAQVGGAPGVNTSSTGMEDIYAILGERYDGGDPDVSARHNEHQP